MAHVEETTATPRHPIDKLIRLQDIPNLPWLPTRRANARLNHSTIYRWATKGAHGKQLKTARVGHELCTTEKWLWEFFADKPAPTKLPIQQHSFEYQHPTIKNHPTIKQQQHKIANALDELKTIFTA